MLPGARISLAAGVIDMSAELSRNVREQNLPTSRYPGEIVVARERAQHRDFLNWLAEAQLKAREELGNTLGIDLERVSFAKGLQGLWRGDPGSAERD